VGASNPVPEVDAVFDPDLVESLFLPVGKQADAIAAGFDSVEVALFESNKCAYGELNH
jgi:hypothetical protein